MLFAFLFAAVVSGSLGHYLRFLGEDWRLFEVWVAFCILSLGSLGISSLGTEGTESMLYGALGGGGGLFCFLAARCSPTLLGLQPCRSIWVLRAVFVGLFTVLASMVWVLGLEALGWKAEEQHLVKEMVQVVGETRILLLVYTIIGAPLIEELLFRGFFWRALRARIPFRAALLINAFLFGALHLDSPHTVPFLMCFGAVLVWLRDASGSLLPSILAHVLNNALVCLTVIYEV
jgi:membrane protease YdiL (CAAX protease family)